MSNNRDTTSGATATSPPISDVLNDAVITALRAPSIHNTQPWKWIIRSQEAELYRDLRWHLPVADPDRKLLTLSCGAALHHARVAALAGGFQPLVHRMPDPDQPDLLARLNLGKAIPVTRDALQLYRATLLRHTDRRPVSSDPVAAELLQLLEERAAAEGVALHILRPEDVTDLLVAVGHAEQVEAGDPAFRAELAYWGGVSPRTPMGVPSSSLLQERPRHRGLPPRDFGAAGTLMEGPGDNSGARYAILHGDGDQPLDWLRAGEALSAVWLTATVEGLSVMPVSAVVEVPVGQAALRRLFGVGVPYLVIRLGLPAAPGTRLLTARRPISDSVSSVSDDLEADD